MVTGDVKQTWLF